MKYLKICLSICYLFFMVTAFAGDEKNTVNAHLKSVIIYRSGAELTHDTKAVLQQGNNELTIDGISNEVDINSIQVKVPNAVTIVGIEFQNYYLKPNIASSKVKAMTDSVEKLQQDITKLQTNIGIATDLLQVLKLNRDIKGTQNGLSVAELIKLMDYYKAKSLEIQTDLVQQNAILKKLQEQVQRLNNQLQEEEQKNAKSTGRLVLQLNAALAGNYNFTVLYITPNAYWTPFYDINVTDINNPMKLVYKAKMFQTTGLDWKQVKLSLSTATPSQWGNAPVLQSWFLAYVNPFTNMDKALLGRVPGVQIAKNELSKSLEDVVVTGNAGAASNIRIRGVASKSGSNVPLYVVNGTPMSASEATKINPNAIKNIDVLKDASSTAIYGARGSNGVILITLKDGLNDYITVSESTLNINYDIDLPYDIASNGKEQTATLKAVEVPTNYKYYAVPKLDKDVYLLAEISNWEKLNLLPGDANIIFEGTYVGKSFIDPNTTTDTLNLTLGKDKRVAIKREKLADFSSVKFLGSNKLQKITYEITVKNNKKEAINLLVKDQYPLATNKEMEVQLLESADASINEETGIVTWKLPLAAGESKKLRLNYTVKYPKDKTVNLK
ncbi:MAG: mucoidy inhibitor MuiA family protein [Flavobacterium sp.]|nr:mucoidy inhibitor MuiA family protein [Flavobacterium sp.]